LITSGVLKGVGQAPSATVGGQEMKIMVYFENGVRGLFKVQGYQRDWNRASANSSDKF